MSELDIIYLFENLLDLIELRLAKDNEVDQYIGDKKERYIKNYLNKFKKGE